MSADAQGREITFAELLARIGYSTDTPQGSAECMSLCQQSPGSHFSGSVSVWSDVPPKAARLAEMSAQTSTNVWFGVNALGEVASGRGKADDVIRLAALIADLDVKEGACPDLAIAYAIIAATSEALGEDHVAVTHSGHGLQPYWAVEPESGRALLAESPAAAKRLGKRFHALVRKVAAEHGCGVDSVFDLPRVFRVPGSVNFKDPENPVPVRCFAGDGKPMTVERIIAALDAAGIPEQPETPRGGKSRARAERKPKDDAPPLNVTAAMTPGQPSKKVSQRLGEAIADLALGLSRHDTTRDHVLGLLRFGRNGQSGVELALIALYRAFYETVGPDRPGGEPEAMEEFVRMCANAETLLAAEPARKGFVWPGPRPKFGSATREDADEEAVAGTVSSAPPSADIEEFWESSAQLRYIRDYARSKLVGPWSTLGGVLVRRVGQVHPKVVLPAVVSGRSSLNLDIGLVGKPSAGKGFGPGRRAYTELMCSPEELGVGSGEGVTHQFIRRVRDPDDPKRHIYQRVRWSVLFTAEEIDTLAALSTRSASTISSQLRKGWSAEPLGFAYVDQDKALPLPEHSYRLCVLTGVQPNRAAPLLDESTGGLPQRFLYLPVNDPDAPDQTPRVPTPEPLPELPDGWKLTGTSDFDEGDLAAPFTPARFVDIGIDAGIVAAVEADRRAGLRDTSYEVRDDDLAAHRNLMRLRSAAALMVLEGRTDITVDDWDRAGLLLAVSESTVTRVREAIKAKSRSDNLAAGVAAATRQKVITESEETDRVGAAGARIVTVLGKNTGGMWWSDLRRAVGVRHRDYAEEGLDYLIGADVVQVEDRTTTTANGAVRKGQWVVSR